MYKKTIIAVLIFSFFGVLLSGYLSYWNLFGPSCHVGPLNWLVSCGGPGKVLIFGQPTCIYGFGMFFSVMVLSVIALATLPKRGLVRALMTLGVVGTLFSAGLIIYEVWILKLAFTGLPACVYGFVLYVGILISSVLASRSFQTAQSTNSHNQPI
ncbi:MAG: hypothetical protein HZC01_03190 [Candidatus Kerfeldbacteria bacterium]|nr:hypothetical protein [Candidatus Kerfeldbacteria bacterium]